jgi:hypothetical protein
LRDSFTAPWYIEFNRVMKLNRQKSSQVAYAERLYNYIIILLQYHINYILQRLLE